MLLLGCCLGLFGKMVCLVDFAVALLFVLCVLE